MIGGLAAAGWYVIPFIVILSVVVFFHELGHYLVGRWCGVKIDAFSLGFGPELFAHVDKRGTRWRVAALPSDKAGAIESTLGWRDGALAATAFPLLVNVEDANRVQVGAFTLRERSLTLS